MIRPWLKPILLLAGVTALGGALVTVAGIIPIKASSGHWQITKWFLEFAKRRSVATHSLSITVPPLDDPDLVLKGATHYELVCRSCHGSPESSPSRVWRAMTPTPPELRPRIRRLKAAELFYIVKHGVKFTGMPAWAARNRDDEIWAMVAFLQKLPSLDDAAYQRLIHAKPPPDSVIEPLVGAEGIPEAVTQRCARCHGDDGQGRGSRVFPKLAGQRREYLQNALDAYARGKRHSGIMEPISAALDPETIGELARHYAGLDAGSSAPIADRDTAAIERGRAIAQHGIPSQRVPSCVDCHVQTGKRYKPAFPALAGQPADYLVLQLDLFKKGYRGGSAYSHLMRAVAPRLTPGQMRDVALYFESVPLF